MIGLSRGYSTLVQGANELWLFSCEELRNRDCERERESASREVIYTIDNRSRYDVERVMGLVLLAALVLGQLVTIEKLANPSTKNNQSISTKKDQHTHASPIHRGAGAARQASS